jgi:D-alanyl-D-alanine carboxypeptidase
MRGCTADLRRPRLILSTDLFRIASVTKTFLATIILQLVAERRLSLDDAVEDWLPGLVSGARAITAGQLLTMRSGLPDYVPAVLGDPPDVARLQRYFEPAELIRIALRQPGRSEPGVA